MRLKIANRTFTGASWLDICYDYNEHSQLLKTIPTRIDRARAIEEFCEKGEVET